MFPTSVFFLVATLAMQHAPGDAAEHARATEAAAVETVVSHRGMVIASSDSVDMVVARIGSDGTPVLACVDDVEAAERFLSAPRETLATRRAREK